MIVAINDEKGLLAIADILYNKQNNIENYDDVMIMVETATLSMVSQQRLSLSAAFSMLHTFLFLERADAAKFLVEYCISINSSSFLQAINEIISSNPISRHEILRALYLLKSSTFDKLPWPGVRAVPKMLGRLPLERFERAVDLGCGTGRVGSVLRASGYCGHLVGVDLSSAMLELARNKGDYQHLVESNILDYFAHSNETFHLITMFWVSAHLTIDDMKRVIAAANHHLNNDGALLLDMAVVPDNVKSLDASTGMPLFPTSRLEATLREACFSVRYLVDGNKRYYTCIKLKPHGLPTYTNGL